LSGEKKGLGLHAVSYAEKMRGRGREHPLLRGFRQGKTGESGLHAVKKRNN